MNRLTVGAIIASLSVASCGGGAGAYTSDILDEGTWAGQFDDTLQITSSGAEDAVYETVAVSFSASVVDASFTTADANAYCQTTEDTSTVVSNPMLCNYEGPGVILSFDADQLYEGQPTGTLAGPTSALELWSQYNRVTTEARVIEILEYDPPEYTPTPTEVEATPSPTEGEASPTPTPEPSPSPDATPAVTRINAICTHSVYTWMYGQLTSRTDAHVILRVTDLTECVDEAGVELSDQFEYRFIESEGTLSLQGG